MPRRCPKRADWGAIRGHNKTDSVVVALGTGDSHRLVLHIAPPIQRRFDPLLEVFAAPEQAWDSREVGVAQI